MLALGCVVLAAIIVVLFARNWAVDTGPGVMTKVKIFLAHVQVSWQTCAPQESNTALLTVQIAGGMSSSYCYSLQVWLQLHSWSVSMSEQLLGGGCRHWRCCGLMT